MGIPFPTNLNKASVREKEEGQKERNRATLAYTPRHTIKDGIISTLFYFNVRSAAAVIHGLCTSLLGNEYTYIHIHTCTFRGPRRRNTSHVRRRKYPSPPPQKMGTSPWKQPNERNARYSKPNLITVFPTGPPGSFHFHLYILPAGPWFPWPLCTTKRGERGKMGGSGSAVRCGAVR